MQVFSQENPDIRVLNYAPGPLKTDMLTEICETSYDSEVKAAVQG